MVQAVVYLIIAVVLLGVWGSLFYFVPVLRWTIGPAFLLFIGLLVLLHVRRGRPTQDEVDPFHRKPPGML